jgi:pseudaminic acid cytidylyltransferase
MNLCIIPARGGSKRIPRKNIKEFCGKPMIGYAIETAKNSGLFEHIVVSTDDDEIATVARNFGAEVPFKRDKELADDHTPTVPVIASAIEECDSLNWKADFVCCIYPCVPLLKVKHLHDGLRLLRGSQQQYSLPVIEFPSRIQRALKKSNDGMLSPFYPEYELIRTQDLVSSFYDAGQFYWGKTEAWLARKNVHSAGVGLVIPNWQAVDIDTNEDWVRAELIFKAFQQGFVYGKSLQE